MFFFFCFNLSLSLRDIPGSCSASSISFICCSALSSALPLSPCFSLLLLSVAARGSLIISSTVISSGFILSTGGFILSTGDCDTTTAPDPTTTVTTNIFSTMAIAGGIKRTQGPQATCTPLLSFGRSYPRSIEAKVVLSLPPPDPALPPGQVLRPAN